MFFKKIKRYFSTRPGLGKFKVGVMMAVRNERHYLERCMLHLRDQGLSVYLIDNGSDDGTREIAERFCPTPIKAIFDHPYPGYFDFKGILAKKEQIAGQAGEDWLIHCDADEILEAPGGCDTLRESIWRVDRDGYDAINFDEFVFVPGQSDHRQEGLDYVATMKHYYFFEPNPHRLVRAWKNKGSSLRLSETGGHRATDQTQKIYPESFVLRHYIALSRKMFFEKYGKRIFADDELAQGWHHNRLGIDERRPPFPAESQLYHYTGDGFDKSVPWKRHFFDPAYKAGQE